MMDGDNRLAHEDFVTGHNGSNPFDILLTILPVITGTFSATLLTDSQKTLYNFSLQYLLCILPLILSFTILSSATISLNVCMLMIAGASWAYFRNVTEKYSLPENKVKCLYLPYLTSCRSTLLICTVIAILGVDFHCFPRRFAKTESYGYSLMDIGVSCFVFMHGAFDRLRKRKSRHILSIVVLLSLGFLRLLSVKATNYQHHVTEYGVHANFFFTLAFLKLLCSWWTLDISVIGGSVFSIATFSFHYILLASGFAEWTLSNAERETLFTANREWFVSIPGYVVIYVLGSITGAFVFSRLDNSFVNQNLKLLGATSVAVAILIFLEIIGIRPSRRLANPSFVVWTTIFVLFFLTLFKIVEDAVEQISRKKFSLVVFECINSNSLLFFLAANLLTGIINFTVDTMKVSFPLAFFIINVYVLFLLLAAYALLIIGNKNW